MEEASFITRRHLIYLGFVLVISALFTFAGGQIVTAVVDIYAFDLPSRPYFQPDHLLLFYFVTPAVILGSLVQFVLPGFLLVLLSGKTAHWAQAVVKAFGLTLIAFILLTTILKFFSPGTQPPWIFLLGHIFLGGLVFVLLVLRVFRGQRLLWPLGQQSDRRRLLWTFLISILIILLMFPVIFWQDMHDDGFEILELGRSLTTHLSPRFPFSIGLMNISLGMLPQAYPVFWNILNYGPLEASARLPLALYLPVLFLVLIALIEWDSTRRMGWVEEALLLLALSIYTVVMGYNASYNVYFADVAAPAGVDTMAAVALLASIYALWSEQRSWFFLFAVLAYFCRPNALFMLVLMAAAAVLFMPGRRRNWLVNIGLALLLCVLLGVLYDRVYIASVAKAEGLSMVAASLLDRLGYIRLWDFMRFNFIIFPSGILPFLTLLIFPLQDRYARFITFLAAVYFLFFFFQGFVALHHFVPVMLLPLVVFWRVYLFNPSWYRNVRILIAVGITGVLALGLSLPRSFRIERTIREIGSSISFRVAENVSNYPDLIAHEELLYELIPPDWYVEDPSRQLVSGPLSLVYYGTREKPGENSINYIIQSAGESAPPGFTMVYSDGTANLYVRDLKVWRRDRHRKLPVNYRSRLYDIPRSTLYSYFYPDFIPEGQVVIDLLQRDVEVGEEQ